jgi:hypothetical protein
MRVEFGPTDWCKVEVDKAGGVLYCTVLYNSAAVSPFGDYRAASSQAALSLRDFVISGTLALKECGASYVH